jgi:hypothetical protein
VRVTLSRVHFDFNFAFVLNAIRKRTKILSSSCSPFTKATSAKIAVFILTREEDWATKLVKLNGGMKIVPHRLNLTNNWNTCEPFTQEPAWKQMDGMGSQLLARSCPKKCIEVGLDAEKEITTPHAAPLEGWGGGSSSWTVDDTMMQEQVRISSNAFTSYCWQMSEKNVL